MSDTIHRTLTILLIGSFLVGLVPACGQSPTLGSRSMDEALLLALASHEQLELAQQEALTSQAGGDYRTVGTPYPKPATPRNPHSQVASMYSRFAKTLSKGSAVRQHFEEQAIKHALLSQSLNGARARRARRRGRGFQRFIRRLARGTVRLPKAIARGVGGLLKGSFRVAKLAIVTAIEQIPQIARDYVMQRLRELRDLAQGKIDLTWDKVARKFGVPFAVWLRNRIDPAFVRMRDRFVAKVLGRRQKATATVIIKPTSTQKEGIQEQPTATQEPTATEEVLPRVSASGQFAETLTGPVNTSRPLGTSFEIVADFATGKVSGNLSGGRTTSGNPIQCVDSLDPSIVIDTAYVDYTDAYKADFSGSLNTESGDFQISITPKGSTSDRKTTPYSIDSCLHLNNQPAPGSTGWTGNGTISGYVTKDGSIEFTTNWSSFGGQIQVRGSWNGAGTVEDANFYDDFIEP